MNKQRRSIQNRKGVRYPFWVVAMTSMIACSGIETSHSAVTPTPKTTINLSDELYDHTHTFHNPGPNNNSFSVGLAMNSDYIFIGARHEERGAFRSGAVYQFSYPSLSFVRDFGSPSIWSTGRFGTRIAANEEVLVVGSHGDDTVATEAGAAYLFDPDTGVLQKTIHSPNPIRGGAFGGALEMAGDTILISATAESVNGITGGVVYQFDLQTGDLIQTLLNPDPHQGDAFGWAMDYKAGRLLVGARRDDISGTDNGAAYLMDLETGEVLRQFHLPNTNQTTADFGVAVALYGDRALIAAHRDDTFGADAGAVYIFDTETGNLLRTLRNPETNRNNSSFGSRVEVVGRNVVVGSTPASNSGGAYMFDIASGDLVHTFVNPSPGSRDYFGASVREFKNRILIGAWGQDTAYLFEPNLPPAFVQRIPAGGGAVFDYESLSAALAEAEDGDLFEMTGFELVDSSIPVTVPNVSIVNTGSEPAGLVQGFDLADGDPLLVIQPTAQSVTINGISFLGTGITEVVDDSLTTGASGLLNRGVGLTLEGCRFADLGSGSFLGGGAVINGSEEETDAPSLVLEDCLLERNSNALRVNGGFAQVVNSQFHDTFFADLLSTSTQSKGQTGAATATVQIMDSTFTTPSDGVDPPSYRVYSAGTPSDFAITGCVIGSAKESNVLFGDGNLNLSYSAVFNHTDNNRDVLTLGSQYQGQLAGIPTYATIDHCDLFNHGTLGSPSPIGDGLGAIVHAGEIPNASGLPIAPAIVRITNTILAGNDAPGADKIGIVFNLIQNGSSQASLSKMIVEHTLIARKGSHALDTSIAGSEVLTGVMSFKSPLYQSPSPVQEETNFGFKYARNSKAATLGANETYIGSAGPGDWLGTTLSIPSGMDFDLRDGTVEIPVSIESASGVAGIDVTVLFDDDMFAAESPQEGPSFASAIFASEIRPGEVQVSMLPDTVSATDEEAILFNLRLTPLAEVEDSPLVFSNPQISTQDFEPFEVELVDGDVTVTVEFIAGDADLSGRVDILDVVAVLRQIVGSQVLHPAGFDAADLSNPDGIDIRDAIALFAIVIDGGTGE